MYLTNAKSGDLLIQSISFYALMSVPCIQMNAVFLMQHKIPTCVQQPSTICNQSCEPTINVLTKPMCLNHKCRCKRESHIHMHMKECPNQANRKKIIVPKSVVHSLSTTSKDLQPFASNNHNMF